MHECDSDRAFAHRGCHAFDVTAASVPDRKDAWKTVLRKAMRGRAFGRARAGYST
jgi:hypothetical protein